LHQIAHVGRQLAHGP